MQTEPLATEPIEIRLSDLPQPYASESARQHPQVVDPPEDPVLRVPPGFAVQEAAGAAQGLRAPRWLALTPEGDVLLAESRENRILRLRDADGDGVFESATPFLDEANGADIPFGMAFLDVGGQTYFFVGYQDEVRRFAYASGERITGTGENVTDLPGGGYNQHWTRNVVATPAGDSLYVTVGSDSNASPEPLPRASVLRIAPDGSGRETVASGLRNPVGLAFHPATGAPYVAVNERDGLGDDLVPDYLTRIRDGEFYGWPYAYLAPGNLDPRNMEGGESAEPELAASTATPDVLFQAHSAALGLDFVSPEAPWPARYHGGAIVAMRGSWNRSEGTGYKLVHVPFRDGRPVGHYEDLMTGFLLDPSVPTTWGRPVGVLAMPDGSVLFTEEANGHVYRLVYRGE